MPNARLGVALPGSTNPSPDEHPAAPINPISIRRDAGDDMGAPLQGFPERGRRVCQARGARWVMEMRRAAGTIPCRSPAASGNLPQESDCTGAAFRTREDVTLTTAPSPPGHRRAELEH